MIIYANRSFIYLYSYIFYTIFNNIMIKTDKTIKNKTNEC